MGGYEIRIFVGRSRPSMGLRGIRTSMFIRAGGAYTDDVHGSTSVAGGRMPEATNRSVHDQYMRI
jgi:hypothetical protein